MGIKDSLRDLNASGDIETNDSSEDEEGIEVGASFYLVSPSESFAVGRNRSRSRGGRKNDYDSDDASVACKLEKDGSWVCQPYRREMIAAEILKANRKGEKGHSAVLNLLRQSGVRVLVVESEVSSTISEIMHSIRCAIKYVSRLERRHSTRNPNVALRCLLYKDKAGRFFNLTLSEYTTAPAYAYEDYLTSFSGIQAMSVLTILCRSFVCATQSDIVAQDFRPAYLGLLLGLVFSEEISYSWVNTAMLVRGIPSISAYSVTTHVETDWLRKILVFCLALSGATAGRTQYIMTFFGISLACAVLLANLGSRAYGFMGWRPIAIGGVFEPIIAYVAAIFVGMVVPYMGHREVGAGGKAAMESVLMSAVIVAVVFVVSDYDDFQQFLVIGSENCNQDYVNIAVGAWWAISLLVSLVLVLQIPTPNVFPDDDEPLLQPDHASPVGFKLPALPDFVIDPLLEQRGLPFLSLKVELALGVVLALAIGGGIVFLAFTEFDEDLANNLQIDTTDNFFGN